MPITADELDLHFGNQDDFALELHVYARALSHGFKASHGGTYEDPLTAKPRQYDVRIWVHREVWTVCLAVECKSLRPSVPLVISRVPRTESENFQYFVWSRFEYAPEGDTSRTPPRSRGDGVFSFGKKCLYRVGEPVGKSTAQVQRTDQGALRGAGDAEIYDKWTQALGSAADLVSEARYGHMTYGGETRIAMVLPVLIVADATLWAIDYAHDGSRQKPKLIDEATLFVDRKYEGKSGLREFSLSHLHIYTRSGFDKFLRALKTESIWKKMFAGLRGFTSPRRQSK